MSMNRYSLWAILTLCMLGLMACQSQDKKSDAGDFDIAGKTWTDGLYFFTATKTDKGYKCEGGSVHEGGILFALMPTDEGFVGAKGNNGLEPTNEDFLETYSFEGNEGDKFLLKTFNGQHVLVQYDQQGKAIGVYTETGDIEQTMKADIRRFIFSGEYTKADGSKVVFSADKPEVTGLSSEASTYEIQTIEDFPSRIITLGNEAFNVDRTDNGLTLQPLKKTEESAEMWEETGKPIVLTRVAGSDDQTGSVEKEALTSVRLEFFTIGERQKMIEAIKAKGDKASEVETINLQMLEAIAAADEEEVE